MLAERRLGKKGKQQEATMLDRPATTKLTESALRTRYDNFIGGE
jgi:hypothetical protein